MQRWSVLSVAAIAVLFIVAGSFFTVRDNRQAALVQAQQPQQDSPGGYRSLRVASEKERAAAATVIKRQLAAFKKRDFSAAMQLQSAPMRSRFASPREFGRMMLGSYPDFCNYKNVRFGRGRVATDKSVWMRVRLETASGNELHSMYQLVWEKGALRVGGVSTGGYSGRPGDHHNRAPHAMPGEPRRAPQQVPAQKPIGA